MRTMVDDPFGRAEERESAFLAAHVYAPTCKSSPEEGVSAQGREGEREEGRRTAPGTKCQLTFSLSADGDRFCYGVICTPRDTDDIAYVEVLSCVVALLVRRNRKESQEIWRAGGTCVGQEGKKGKAVRDGAKYADKANQSFGGRASGREAYLLTSSHTQVGWIVSCTVRAAGSA